MDVGGRLVQIVDTEAIRKLTQRLDVASTIIDEEQAFLVVSAN